MAVHDFAVAAHQTRNLETELFDERPHATHGGIVLSRVFPVRKKPIDEPDFNLISACHKFSKTECNDDYRE